MHSMDLPGLRQDSYSSVTYMIVICYRKDFDITPHTLKENFVAKYVKTWACSFVHIN